MAIQIRRRELIVALGGAAVWPLAARAQQARRTHTIGYLSPAIPDFHGTFGPYFFNALQELGWIEGQNIAIERRYAENRLERLPELAAELVRLNVEVIVATGFAKAFSKYRMSSPPGGSARLPLVHSRLAWPHRGGRVLALVDATRTP